MHAGPVPGETCQIIMKWYWFLLPCLVMGQATAQPAKKTTALHYVFVPEPAKGELAATLSFTGNKDGLTTVQLPNAWGGLTALYRNLGNIYVTGADSIARNPSDSSLLLIYHPPAVPLTVQYVLRNNVPDSLPAQGQAYMPLIKPQYLHLIGYTLMAYPDGYTHFNGTIEWRSIPENWRFTSSMSPYRMQHFKNVASGELPNSLWIAGDYRLYAFSVRKKPVQVALRGQWPFADSTIVNLLQQTIPVQRRFWKDFAIDRFTVSLIPLLTPDVYSSSLKGTALHHCFASFATNNAHTSLELMQYIYNHELMHHWIGGIIKNESPEELYYWFSEGFTDYFTWQNMLQGGLITREQYERNIDSVLALHYSNQLNASPNALIKTKFWEDPLFQKLPYHRGFLFAWYLDGCLQQQTRGRHTLKAVMVRLLRQAKKGARFSEKLLLDAVQPYLVDDVTPAYREYIEAGKFIPLEAWQQNTPYPLALREVPVFSIGFTTDKGGLDVNAKVTAVTEGSNAALAGLRPGDIIKGYSFAYNPHQEASLVILRNNQRIDLKYYPAHKMMLPQLNGRLHQ
jgi:predicted metalloprotease with PDZ domain